VIDSDDTTAQTPYASSAPPLDSAELHILRRCLQRIDKTGNLDGECKEELTRLVLERILKLGRSRI
jgi:hypothetical protein